MKGCTSSLTRTLLATYVREELSPEGRVLIERTLPARAARLVRLAKKAADAL